MRFPRAAAVVAAAAVTLTSAGLTAVAHAARTTSTLTVLSTTDVHGHVYNWDYFQDAEFSPDTTGRNSAPLGLTRAATIIKQTRQDRGANSVVTVDNGDTIQGTPLTYLASQEPERLGDSTNPMARAFNLIGYDATNTGNHEFNYGVDVQNNFAKSLDAPLLGANVIDVKTGEPLRQPTTMVTKKIDGHDVKVGIVGVTTPGSAVWDRSVLKGRVDLTDPVAAADKYAGQLRRQGADVVVTLVHGGLDEENATPIYKGLDENMATSVATKAKGVDLVISGHTHRDDVSTVVDGASGHKVLISQPDYWARSVSDVQIPLSFSGDKVGIDYGSISTWATQRYTRDVAEDSELADNPQLRAAHEKTITYVNSVVATSTEEMSAKKSMVEDTPILDFIGSVEADTVSNALKKTKYADTPVIAQVSPFSRTALFPKGEVKIKDIAGLYVFDNTLAAVEITGAQLRDYLEYSARYFVQTKPGEKINPAPASEGGHTQATIGGKTIWDYNYDAVTGVKYSIDISKPVGQRVLGLSWQGKPVNDNQKFIMAINNYRMNGGGGYPHVSEAPVAWDGLVEIRQELIDHASRDGKIDPTTFFDRNWFLTTTGETWQMADDQNDTSHGGRGTGETSAAPAASRQQDTNGTHQISSTDPRSTGLALPRTGV